MLIIIPGFLVRWLRPFILFGLLLSLMFVAGLFVALTAVTLVTARQSLGSADVAAIPAALVAGFFFFRLGRQVFKGPMDDHDGGLLSSVGFTACVIFFSAVVAFGGGAYLGGRGRYQYTAHPSSHEAATEQSPAKGRIYIAPATAPAPKPATTTHS